MVDPAAAARSSRRPAAPAHQPAVLAHHPPLVAETAFVLARAAAVRVAYERRDLVAISEHA